MTKSIICKTNAKNGINPVTNLVTIQFILIGLVSIIIDITNGIAPANWLGWVIKASKIIMILFMIIILTGKRKGFIGLFATCIAVTIAIVCNILCSNFISLDDFIKLAAPLCIIIVYAFLYRLPYNRKKDRARQHLH